MKKKIQLKKVKERKWLKKIQCFFFGHWWNYCPDKSGDQFCERGCGKCQNQPKN